MQEQRLFSMALHGGSPLGMLIQLYDADLAPSEYHFMFLDAACSVLGTAHFEKGAVFASNRCSTLANMQIQRLLRSACGSVARRVPCNPATFRAAWEVAERLRFLCAAHLHVRLCALCIAFASNMRIYSCCAKRGSLHLPADSPHSDLFVSAACLSFVRKRQIRVRCGRYARDIAFEVRRAADGDVRGGRCGRDRSGERRGASAVAIMVNAVRTRGGCHEAHGALEAMR